MKYEHIFWDWNGTLLDDARASCNAVNTMLNARCLPNITMEQYRNYLEVPIIRFYEKVMDVSKESMENLSVEFNSLLAKNLSASPLVPFACEILEVLHKSGVKQYIFSSSQNKLIEPFLQRFSIDKYFTCVLGAPDCYVGSKVERTRDYLESNGIDKQKSLFVGDMVHDSEVASAVGADCILVSNGHQCENALRATGRQVVSSLPDLLALLNDNKSL